MWQKYYSPNFTEYAKTNNLILLGADKWKNLLGAKIFAAYPEMFSFESSGVGDVTADDGALEGERGIGVDDALRLRHVEDHRGQRWGHLEVESEARCCLVDAGADEGRCHDVVSRIELK